MSKKNPKPEEWPAVLKAWRKRRSYTQKQAAEVIDCSLSAYRQWEQGVAQPTMMAPSLAREILID